MLHHQIIREHIFQAFVTGVDVNKATALDRNLTGCDGLQLIRCALNLFYATIL
jgi:hypothetical protein